MNPNETVVTIAQELNRVISCFRCGSVLAIYADGDRVPATPHTCGEDFSC